ncbi:hypothetical protein [Halopelagius longus]|uniref:Uncharacterized protein n=1 Tax=Halopelagius longus TaxID=1236180 RepID=A0A1H1AEZ2_9EURY|nr:hypothetical protein [Halopelagius longus]RDI70355.1 hypothetical protein DWB78_00695 [Halopelagius longus]SDQ38242.1 hypothetical protein SAMN05216278_1305 [Halopelagius longus]
MPVVSARTFERWLRRLDSASLREFVRDLYAAAGREVRVRGDGTLAVGSDGRVVVTVSARRRLRTPRVPDDADVVVAASPSRRLVGRVTESGATLVGPSDLRTLALYGADRDDCERLFRRYFDESPSVERPDAVAARETDGDRRHASVRGVERIAADPVSGLAVLALAGLVVAALLGTFGVAPETGDSAGPTAEPVVAASSDRSSDSDADADVNADADAGTSSDRPFPPGVGPTGVADAETLAAAHADAVAGRSYQLIVRRSGTDARTGGWPRAYRRAEVASPTRYRSFVTGYRATGDGGTELVHCSMYADGEYTYVYREHGEERSYARYAVETDEEGHGPFENRAAAAVRRYLNAPRTTVTRKNWSVQPYRVVATGTPASLPNLANVTDYRAEARVGADGFVSRLLVSYEVRAGEETRSVSFRMEYADADPRTVRAPPWYGEARNATDDAPSEAAAACTPARTRANETQTASLPVRVPGGAAGVRF